MTDFNKKSTLIQVDVDNDKAIAAIEKSTNSLLSQQAALKQNNAAIKELEKSNKELNKEVKKGGEDGEKASKSIKKNETQISLLTKKIF